jgi:RNA polymerase sigma-70 factor (ECF subfamily)
MEAWDMADAVQSDLGESGDEVLIERILSGDRDAFDFVYERYFGRIYAFVHKRLHNRADTEETVQEVFISAFSSLGSFRGEAPFAAWLLGVARRVVASRFKKKRHPTVPLEHEEQVQMVDLLMPLFQRSVTPLEHYECQERIARLEANAVRRLTVEQRRLFELHHLRHRSITDIADLLDKSEDAVKSNLYRARKALLTR